MSIFNSTNQFAGYYQTFKGGKAAISIKRSSGGNSATADAKSGKGFMVSQYQVVFQRNVGIQRFLNMDEAVALVGAGQGTMTLTGLIGTLDDFKALLLGSNKNEEDICDQLVVAIKDCSSFNQCGQNGNTNNASGTIECSGGIVQGIQLTGQIDQSGMIMQTANLTIQFTELDLK